MQVALERTGLEQRKRLRWQEVVHDEEALGDGRLTTVARRLFEPRAANSLHLP
jgi:hypothetical protein